VEVVLLGVGPDVVLPDRLARLTIQAEEDPVAGPEEEAVARDLGRTEDSPGKVAFPDHVPRGGCRRGQEKRHDLQKTD